MTFPLVGAGTTFAGAGPAGLDPVGAYSEPGILNPFDGQQVALFDLATKSTPIDLSTGLVKLVHWVDQAVALALGITNGTFTPQTSLGNRLRLIPRNDPIRLAAEVLDAVRVALFDLVERRDIVVTEVLVNQPITSQVVVAVTYINLRTANAAKIPANLSFVF